MKGMRNLYLHGAALALIGAAVFACYSPAIQAGFVYDDPLLIHDNYMVTDSSTSVADIFIHPYFGVSGGGTGYYRPLMTLLYRWEFNGYGGEAFGFHLDNLLIHCAVCFALFFFLRMGGVGLALSFAAGMLFAVHPALTESIAWISGRTDPLAFLFMMGSLLLLFCRFREDRPGKRYFWLSLVCFFPALLIKEVACILPLALLPLLYPKGGDRKKAIFMFAAFAGAVLVVFGASALLTRAGDTVFYCGEGNTWQKGITFLSLVPAYMGKLFWPVDLNIAHPTQLAESLLDLRVLGGGLILLFALALMIMGWVKRNVPLFAGAVLLVFGLGAVSNLVPIPIGFREMEFPFFERYLYIPLAGLLMMGGALIPGKRGWAIAALIAVAGLCPLLGRATLQRSLDWNDNVSLFQAGVAAYPESPSLWFNLGQAHYEESNFHEALPAFDKAFALDPFLDMARVQGAMTLFHLGRREEANARLHDMVELNPSNWQSYEALGYQYALEERWDQALVNYTRAAGIYDDPHITASRERAAQMLQALVEMLYEVQKDYKGVLYRCNLVLEQLGDRAWAYEYKGLALHAQGKWKEGREALEQARACYGRQGQHEEGERILEILENLDP